MKFARVQGHGRLIDTPGEGSLSLVVTLDDGRRVEMVRSETVDWLEFGPAGDIGWQIDQYTQETLGSTLAGEGWEVVSQDESANVSGEDGITHSSVFVARKAGWS